MAMKGIHKAQSNLTKNHSQPHGGAMKTPVMAPTAKTGSVTANSRAGSKFTKSASQAGGKNHTPDRSAHGKKHGYNDMKGSFGCGGGIFRTISSGDSFRGTNKKGVLRTSGSGHMLGSKK